MPNKALIDHIRLSASGGATVYIASRSAMAERPRDESGDFKAVGNLRFVPISMDRCMGEWLYYSQWLKWGGWAPTTQLSV